MTFFGNFLRNSLNRNNEFVAAHGEVLSDDLLIN